eukprot:3722201-Amphidinium_carterae.1
MERRRLWKTEDNKSGNWDPNNKNGSGLGFVWAWLVFLGLSCGALWVFSLSGLFVCVSVWGLGSESVGPEAKPSRMVVPVWLWLLA